MQKTFQHFRLHLLVEQNIDVSKSFTLIILNENIFIIFPVILANKNTFK